MSRNQIKLQVILIPDSRASIIAPQKAPAFVNSEGTTDMTCGGCGVVLIEGKISQMAAPVQLLIKCPQCGVHNKVPAAAGH